MAKKPSKSINELIELNDELENYFRNTIIPQLFVDANLILRKFTPPAMKQFDLNKGSVGKPMADLTDNIRYSNIEEDVKEVIKSGEVLEKEIQTADLRWFQMNILPYVLIKTKETNGVIITFVDITERINDLKELETLNAAHETFIYAVSHDLKAPLANIEGLIQALRGWEKDHEQITLKQMIDKSISAMRNVIDELAEITKIKAGVNANIENINFGSLLKEVQLVLRDQINSSKAIIKTDFKVEGIKFTRKNLRSIMYNLLSNAIKYKSSDRTPEILIKTRKEKGFVVFSIKDNSVGIAKKQQDFIFSEFTRIEKSLDGTGIGLYLLKKIVDNEGGKIVLDSKVGEGSEFKIYLKDN